MGSPPPVVSNHNVVKYEGLMQEVRLWEVINEKGLREVQSSQIAFEQRLEDWLAKDISVLGPELVGDWQASAY